MKKAGAILILLGATIGMAACAVGPCEGYGCPAFAGAAQVPQPATKADVGSPAALARGTAEPGQ